MERRASPGGRAERLGEAGDPCATHSAAVCSLLLRTHIASQHRIDLGRYRLSRRKNRSTSASRRMVMDCLTSGRTRRASFQNASSVGLTSGSRASPALISASLIRLRRSQSVPVLRAAVTRAEIRAALLRGRFPCRDDAPFILFPIRIDHRDDDAVHFADRVDANLAILLAIIEAFDRGTLKNRTASTSRCRKSGCRAGPCLSSKGRVRRISCSNAPLLRGSAPGGGPGALERCRLTRYNLLAESWRRASTYAIWLTVSPRASACFWSR